MAIAEYRDTLPRALIVDDDPLGLITTAEIMERLGIASDAVESPDEALKKAHAIRYDYIVLDISMPSLNGYELCSAIRNGDCKSKRAFIVALSGKLSDESHVTECLKVGICDVLTKPITEEQMHKRMGYWHFAIRNAKFLTAE